MKSRMKLGDIETGRCGAEKVGFRSLGLEQITPQVPIFLTCGFSRPILCALDGEVEYGVGERSAALTLLVGLLIVVAKQPEI